VTLSLSLSLSLFPRMMTTSTNDDVVVVVASSGAALITQLQNEEEEAKKGTEFALTKRRGGGGGGKGLKRKRDTTSYYQLISEKGKEVFGKFQEYVKGRQAGSVDQYVRYVARYLYFLEEQTTSEEGGEDNGFVHHISEALFEAFVVWYGKRAEEFGYADNDQKTPYVALQLLLRMFLEQDDEEEEKLTSDGGTLAPEKRRFRESEHLSLAQAREIIKKKDKGITMETFFNRRGKDSAVMKKRAVKRLEKKEARSNGTAAMRRRTTKSKSTLRARNERKVGRRDGLWDVIVDNDDICFNHILPKLKATDIKFLFEVNSETRALIKRSPAKDALKVNFTVEEMSSISTLELAFFFRSFWRGSLGSETDFCGKVAATSKLELLQWAREEKKCRWNQQTFIVACMVGNLEMIKYCFANECPIWDGTCSAAAANGHLEVLKYLREEIKIEWDWETASWAALKGHLHILEYLVESKFFNQLPSHHHEFACINAAKGGQLDCLKYLRETAKWPWGALTLRTAHENNRPECLQYCLDNNCPLPEGWSYAHGELHAAPDDSDSELSDYW